MKKKKNTRKPETLKSRGGNYKFEEPSPVYPTSKPLLLLKEFTYTEFKKIADKTPFTQAEWASMLHISERTLQRYAKFNGHFASMNAERILQIASLLKEAAITFGSVDKFYQWIKRNPYMLEGDISLSSLNSFDGIEKVLTQLKRIQHGLFA